MSKSALQILARISDDGLLPVVFDAFSGPIPGTATKLQGLWINPDTQAVYAADVAISPVDHYANGLPFDANGRIVASFGTPLYYHQGLAFCVDGGLCAAQDFGDYYDQGLRFSAGALGFKFDNPPPIQPVTLDWHYPYIDDGNNTKGAGVTTTLRGSVGHAIKTASIEESAIDVPIISQAGLHINDESYGNSRDSNDLTLFANTVFGAHVGTKSFNVTPTYVPSPSGVPATPDNGYTQIRQNATTLNKVVQFSFATTPGSASNPNLVHLIYKVAGTVPRLRLGTQNLGGAALTTWSAYNDFDADTGQIYVQSNTNHFQFVDIGNGYRYVALEAPWEGNFATACAKVMFLDGSGNSDFLGDVNNGLDVFAVAYGRTFEDDLYSPILGTWNAGQTRLAPTEAYSETSQAAATATNFTWYFKIDVTQNFLIDDDTVVAFYGDMATVTGYAILYLYVEDEYTFVPLINGTPLVSTSQVRIDIPPAARGDSLEFMLEIPTAAPGNKLRGTINAFSAESVDDFDGAALNNLNRFYPLFNDPASYNAFGRYTNAKRGQGVGHTLEEMRVAT